MGSRLIKPALSLVFATALLTFRNPKNMGRGSDEKLTVEQGVYPVPDIPIKELLDTIPAHCFKRSAFWSSTYLVWDCIVIWFFYKITIYGDDFLNTLQLSSPYIKDTLKFALWAHYSFWAGLFGTGLWVIGHECGHQAFSESTFINNTVGWIVHSALGVPYHSWRISHAKHHASTGHVTQDQVFVAKTRSQRGLPPFDPTKEDRFGSSVTEAMKKELWDAIGDSPIGAILMPAAYLLVGWPAYLFWNSSGPPKHRGSNHFSPSSTLFAPHHYGQIVMSTVGVLLWLAGIAFAIQGWGFLVTFRTYLAPYLWVNHWLIIITYLQHTDPLVPHYRAPEFNFTRGALTTLDRNLLGDLGSVMGWIGCHATNSISETHILHHVSSKIPHYNAWEASRALKKKLASCGIPLDGRPGGWAEVFRVFRECKFVEDEGDVVFYKNAYGLAQMRPQLPAFSASDSGVEVDTKDF